MSDRGPRSGRARTLARHCSTTEDMEMNSIRRVTVVGLGTLGTQIAVQASAYGYEVSGFARNVGTFDDMQAKIRGAMQMTRKGPTFPAEQWAEHASRVKLYDDLARATSSADLVIESVPEVLETKRTLFAQLDQLAPAHAILASNSSSIPISRIESATRRPEKCLNLLLSARGRYDHGRRDGWNRTSPESLLAACDFVRAVGCVPLRVQKEIQGFCFNSVWRAVKRQTLYMWAGGYVDFRDIDRAWMVFTGNVRPFLPDGSGRTGRGSCHRALVLPGIWRSPR